MNERGRIAMKKESILLGLAVLVGILVYVGVLYGAYMVTSPTLSVKVEEYVLTMDQSATTVRIGESVQFFGTLTQNGAPMVGETVALYYGNGTLTGLSDVTIIGGVYTIAWTATRQGTFEFYAQFELP
jgi:hypothetical protein